MAYKNKKIAFVFPGQGSQYVGMAKDFLNENQEILGALRDFDKETGENLEEIILNGPEEKLKETQYTQPAIVLHSIAALQYFKKNIEIEADFVAGHSLGEYSAMVASGILSLKDTMKLVYKRGQFMAKAYDSDDFAMSAIMGLEPEEIKEICEQVSQENLVVVANYNSLVQTVISGTKLGVEKANEKLKEKGAKKVVPLVVGGPFHSPLIAKAANLLEEELTNFNFKAAQIPIFANVDAKAYTDAKKIKNNLIKQIISSVQWVNIIKNMQESGVEIFIEFGPQSVISGMIKKIDRKITTFNVDTIEEAKLTLKKLEEL